MAQMHRIMLMCQRHFVGLKGSVHVVGLKIFWLVKVVPGTNAALWGHTKSWGHKTVYLMFLRLLVVSTETYGGLKVNEVCHQSNLWTLDIRSGFTGGSSRIIIIIIIIIIMLGVKRISSMVPASRVYAGGITFITWVQLHRSLYPLIPGVLATWMYLLAYLQYTSFHEQYYPTVTCVVGNSVELLSSG